MIDDEDIDLGREGDDEDEPVRRFTARYESECACCGAQIDEGDRAGYIGNDTEASCIECCGGE